MGLNNMFDFQEAAGTVGGWLTRSEGIFLYEAAKRVSPQNVIVEIGSWKGKSTICLGHGSKDGGQNKVVAIDPHIGSSEHQRQFGKVDTFREFKTNINKASISQYVAPIRDTSENAARNFQKDVGFIFIDGAHEYRLVMLDYQLWFPKVTNGGILAFHDSWAFPGPNLATAIILCTSTEVKNPKLIDTITCFEKTYKNSLFDRIQNISFVIYRIFFGVVGLAEISRRGGRGI